MFESSHEPGCHGESDTAVHQRQDGQGTLIHSSNMLWEVQPLQSNHLSYRTSKEVLLKNRCTYGMKSVFSKNVPEEKEQYSSPLHRVRQYSSSLHRVRQIIYSPARISLKVRKGL